MAVTKETVGDDAGRSTRGSFDGDRSVPAGQSQGTDWTTVGRPATVEARGPACGSAEARRRGPRSGGGARALWADFLTWAKEKS